jgi:predicted nucleic acid-binding Zn ribbon protein
MPIFQTKCTNNECGHRDDRIAKNSEELPPCAKCGGELMKIQTHEFAFSFANGGGCHSQRLSSPSRN